MKELTNKQLTKKQKYFILFILKLHLTFFQLQQTSRHSNIELPMATQYQPPISEEDRKNNYRVKM